jgi:hypothetical protein
MKRSLSILLCAQLGANFALAWGSEGHMVVAAIAFNKLNDPVKAKIVALLQKNPMYSTWVQGVAQVNQAAAAFITAATWPDVIKSAKGYVDDGEHPKTPGTAARNIGYKDKLQHRYWHFFDTPFSPDGTATETPLAPNARTQIALFRATLADASGSDDVRSYDLVWLIHLVGDVHQPLHATTRFDVDQPDGDEGGNQVATCNTPKCRDELHGFWDDVPGTSKTVSAAQKKAATIAAATAAQAKIADEAQWIDESFQLAKSDVYVPPVLVGAGPYLLTAAYKANAKTVADKRLALAGERLANLLNEALQ